MNEEQLLKILKKITQIRALLAEDAEGVFEINNRLCSLEEAVRRELKAIVWAKYQKVKGI